MIESGRAVNPTLGKHLVEMKLDGRTDKSVTIHLSDGSKIELEALPYEGWGTTQGHRYTTVRVNDENKPIMETLRTWTVVIPAAYSSLSGENSDIRP